MKIIKLLLVTAFAGLIAACSGGNQSATSAPQASPEAAPGAAEESRPSVLIFGATGTMGSAFVEEGLLRGYDVIGVSRDASKFDHITWPHFTGVSGDVTDIDSMRPLVADADYVLVSVMGIATGSYNEVTEEDAKTPTPEESVQNQAAQNLITLSREMGDAAPRIIQVNGGSTIYYNGKWLFDYMPAKVAPVPGTAGHSIMWGHHVVLDTYAAAPDVKWSIASAPPGVEFGVRGERTERPIWTGPGEFELPEEDLQLEFKGKFIDAVRHISGDVSAVDFGRAIFDEFENEEYIGKRFTMLYADGERVKAMQE